MQVRTVNAITAIAGSNSNSIDIERITTTAIRTPKQKRRGNERSTLEQNEDEDDQLSTDEDFGNLENEIDAMFHLEESAKDAGLLKEGFEHTKKDLDKQMDNMLEAMQEYSRYSSVSMKKVEQYFKLRFATFKGTTLRGPNSWNVFQAQAKDSQFISPDIRGNRRKGGAEGRQAMGEASQVLSKVWKNVPATTKQAIKLQGTIKPIPIYLPKPTLEEDLPTWKLHNAKHWKMKKKLQDDLMSRFESIVSYT